MAQSSGNALKFFFSLKKQKLRYEVIVNARPMYLTSCSYFYLLTLAVQAATTPDGWIKKDNIDCTNNQTRYIYQLNKELRQNNIGTTALIENDKSNRYRLNIQPENLRFDHEAMRTHDDARIRQLSDKFNTSVKNPSLD